MTLSKSQLFLIWESVGFYLLSLIYCSSIIFGISWLKFFVLMKSSQFLLRQA